MTIVVQNRYFARPGREAEALRLRWAASAARAAGGRREGRILTPVEQAEGIPTFVWECAYLDLTARRKDVAWVESSASFQAIRERMATLLDHFERAVYEVAAGSADSNQP